MLPSEALGLWSAAVGGVHFRCLGALSGGVGWYCAVLFPTSQVPFPVQEALLSLACGRGHKWLFWVVSEEGLPPENLHLCELPWEPAKLRVSLGSMAVTFSYHLLSRVSLTISVT